MPISREDFAKMYPGQQWTETPTTPGVYGWGDRAEAGLMSAGSQILSGAESLGLDGVADTRRLMQARSEALRQRSILDTGAPESMSDINSLGSLGKGVLGLALDSAPQLAANIAVGAATGGASLPVQLGAMAAVNAPFNYGDIVQNQMEQSGSYRPGAAAALTVPYTALDMIGLEGRLARIAPMHVSTEALDAVKGVRGGAARMAGNFVYGGVGEGISEAGQEVVNQLGRMSVDPSSTLTTDDAPNRYLDSFLGGALLGGSVSAGLGGWRRSEHYQPPGVQPGTDIGTGETPANPPAGLQLGYNPNVAPPADQLVAMPDGSQMWASEYAAQQEAAARQQAAASNHPGFAGPQGVVPNWTGQEGGEAAAPLGPAQQAFEARKRELEEENRKVELYQAQATDAADELGVPKKAGHIQLLGEAIRAATDGVMTPQAFGTLVAELSNTGNPKALAAARKVLVEARKEAKANEGKAATAAAIKQNDASMVQSASDALLARLGVATNGGQNGGAGQAGRVDAGTGGQPTADAGGSTQAGVVPAVPGTGAGSAVATGTGAPGRAVGTVDAGGVGTDAVKPEPTVTLTFPAKEKGGEPRQVELTKQAWLARLSKSATNIQQRVAMAMGLEADVNPDTGEVEMRQVRDPMPMRQIAEIESLRTGKPVTEEAVRKSLAGLGITPEVLDKTARSFAPGNTLSEAEAEIPTGEGRQDGHMRVEDSLARAAGEGLVQSGEAMTAEEKAHEAEVQKLLGKKSKKQDVDTSDALTAEESAAIQARNEETRKKNEAHLLRQAPRILAHPGAIMAAKDWTSDVVSWDALPTLLKLDWVREYNDLLDSNGGDFGQREFEALDRVQANIERIARVTTQASTSAREAPRAESGLSDGVGANRQDPGPSESGQVQQSGGQEAGEAGPDAGGAYDGETGQRVSAPAPKVVTRKKRTIVKPEQAEKTETAVQEAKETPAQQATEPEDDPRTYDDVQRPGPARSAEVPATRTPSFAAAARTALRQFWEGRISEGALVARLGAALTKADLARESKPNNPRVRGVDFVRQRLLEVKRKGWISPEAAEFADWVLRSNPQFAEDLGVSFKSGEGDGGVGQYNPITRVFELAKEADTDETAVHEIMHHLERMMPPEVQRQIGAAWMKSLVRGMVQAERNGSPEVRQYYELLRKFHLEGGNKADLDAAMKLLTSGKVGYEHYQNFNPSEYWAVNATRIMQGRFDGSSSMTGRLGVWLRELAQKLKSLVGLTSDSPVIAALNSLAKGDGKFQSKSMLAENADAYNMYVGLQSKLSPMQKSKQAAAEDALKAGKDPEEVRSGLGWFKGEHDGMWRTELDDSKSRLKMPESELRDRLRAREALTLGDVLDHPDLYAAQPGLKALALRPLPRGEAGFFAKEFAIGINPAVREDIRSLLIHEVQHAVQDAEGFDTGSNVGRAWRSLDPKDLLTLLTEDLRPALKESAGVAAQALIDDGDMDAIGSVLSAKSKFIAYRGVTGEREANDTQGRLRMSASERRSTAPSTTPSELRGYPVVRDLRGDTGDGVTAGASYMNVARPKVSEADRAVMDAAPAKVRAAAKAVSQVISDMASSGLKHLMFTRDLAAKAAELIPSAAKYVELTLANQAVRGAAERRIERVVQAFSMLPKHERGTGPGSVNALLKASTSQRAWAYRPQFLQDAKVDPALAEQFKALSPAAQQVVRDVFEHGHESLQRLKAAIEQTTSAEYDAAIADARNRGDKAAEERAVKEKALTMRRTSELVNFDANWPYTPLSRFGNHVVIGMSEEYMQAENEGKTAEMIKMQGDARHYYVAFAETKQEARVMAEKLRGQYAYSDHFNRDDGSQGQMTGAMLNDFYRLRKMATESADASTSIKANKALDTLLRDLHLSLLSEASARQAERQRKDVAGADNDMMRAFATRSRAAAHFISNIENAPAIHDAMEAMKREADERKPGRDERREYYNELMKRRLMDMQFNPQPVVEKAMAASSVWMLLTSPAHYLQNVTQPYVMSLPLMAGKHGYSRAASELTRAYKDLAPLLEKGVVTEATFDKLPADVRTAMKALLDSGHLTPTGMEQLGDWSSDDTTFGQVMGKMRSVAEKIEAVNRLTTAMAAARLEAGASRPGNAVSYAQEVVYRTHGDYSGFNSPRLMRQGFGRLATQFRKFQLIQLGMYAKLFREAFGDGSPEEKAAARWALTYSLAHMGALGGMIGLPGAKAIGWLLGLIFGDDDEPDNQELTVRRALKGAGIDGSMADALVKGVPAAMGLDLSGKLGAGGMLSLFPYADTGMDRKGVEAAIVAAAGPFIGGLLPRMAEGVNQMAQGNYYRGLEGLMPSGVANAIKAVRFASEGVTTNKGLTAMKPEDLSAVDLVFQGLGLPTSTLTDRQFRANAAFDTKGTLDKRSGAITTAYVKAVKAGDSQGAAEARKEWAEFQASRKRQGYAVQPLSTLLKAPQEQAKREREMVGGIEVGKQNRQFAQELEDL